MDWLCSGEDGRRLTVAAVPSDKNNTEANPIAVLRGESPPLTSNKSSSLNSIYFLLAYSISSSAENSKFLFFAKGIIFSSTRSLSFAKSEVFSCTSLSKPFKLFANSLSLATKS